VFPFNRFQQVGVNDSRSCCRNWLAPTTAKPGLRFILTPSTPASPDLLVLCIEHQTKRKLFRRRAETAIADLYWETNGSMQSAYRLPYDLANGFSKAVPVSIPAEANRGRRQAAHLGNHATIVRKREVAQLVTHMALLDP
jgi:hypothetical protein